MKLFDAADAVRKLVTTPDDLGPCQQYCEALKDEVRRLRTEYTKAVDRASAEAGRAELAEAEAEQPPASATTHVPDTPDPAEVDAALAKWEMAIRLSDEWRATWTGSWPQTAPPDGAYECSMYDEVRDGIKTLAAAVRKLRSTVGAAMALLNPTCTEETLCGAIRNLQQAHLSEKGNAEQAEAALAALKGRMTEAALADDCHHCNEPKPDGAPCHWCGRTAAKEQA